MNVVIADACPVIFLAKLDQLALIKRIFPGTILLPTSVKNELIVNTIPVHEQHRIEKFLTHCQVKTVHHPLFPALTISSADSHVLTLAKTHKNSLILTDDSLIRRIAQAENIPVAGTLGIIIRAVRKKILSTPKALQSIDELVSTHHLRISVELYKETLQQIHHH